MKRFLKFDTKDAKNGDVNVDPNGVMHPVKAVIIKSSSGKKFILNVSDTGELSTTEIPETGGTESNQVLG